MLKAETLALNTVNAARMEEASRHQQAAGTGTLCKLEGGYLGTHEEPAVV